MKNFKNLFSKIINIFSSDKAQKENLNDKLKIACFMEHFHHVKVYLKSGADINCNRGEPLLVACNCGHINVVRFLLTEPTIQNADPYVDDCKAFKQACISNRQEIVNYLIFDYKMKIPTHLTGWLMDGVNDSGMPKMDVLNMIQKRDLFEELHQRLSNQKDSTTKTHKL